MKARSQMFSRKGVSKTVCFLAEKLLPANKVLQSYARNLRAPALNCAQDDSKKTLYFQVKKLNSKPNYQPE
ncbi:hypothetical protein [Adhaeribacter terreus]|uniref:Uncharacterized protein n=1 Tax=Adhaeribacter terreus TaxID=529703 RepID=A0ABW0E6A9_9BACT